MSLQVVLLVDLLGLQVRRFAVAGILQHQGLGAVADHDPRAMIDFGVHQRHLQNRNISPSVPSPVEETTFGRWDGCWLCDGQFEPSSRRRAITCAWISAAPSKIDRMRASQRMRE